MRLNAWLRLLALSLAVSAGASCSSYQGPVDQPADAGGVLPDAGVDAPVAPTDSGTTDTAAPDDAKADAAQDGPPLGSFLVLRFEADAPNGFQASGAFRDLSPKNQNVTLAAGTVQLAFSGSEGAKSVTLGTVAFAVDDTADLRFGTTDDFMYVARISISPPEDPGGGCSFRYLASKFDADGARSPNLRTCWKVGAHELLGGLYIAQDIKVIAPDTITTGFDIMSFGRYMNGTRAEAFVAGAMVDDVLPPRDVSAPGNPFTVGAARLPNGAVFGYLPGKLNRFYVYRAPGGTFTKADFKAARDYLKSARPIP